MNDIPKVVFSKTLTDAEATWPETRVARGDLATEIAAIKAEPGPEVIVWRGSRLVGALAAADLVDEYRLLVQPLVLGRGQALFDQLLEPRHWTWSTPRRSRAASLCTSTDPSTPEREDP
jgi:dihydrofolate reductase